MIRFDRFSERAQAVAQRASEIVQRYGHGQMELEHLLLALFEQPDRTIGGLVEALYVNSEALIKRLDSALLAKPRGAVNSNAGKVFITPGVARVIKLAEAEARREKSNLISTRQMFLATLLASENAVQVKKKAGFVQQFLSAGTKDEIQVGDLLKEFNLTYERVLFVMAQTEEK